MSDNNNNNSIILYHTHTHTLRQTDRQTMGFGSSVCKVAAFGGRQEIGSAGAHEFSHQQLQTREGGHMLVRLGLYPRQHLLADDIQHLDKLPPVVPQQRVASNCEELVYERWSDAARWGVKQPCYPYPSVF